MKKPYKYVAIYESYADCPSCDGKSYNEFRFYNELRDFLHEVKEEYFNGQFTSLVRTTGKELSVPWYDVGGHNVKGCEYKLRNYHIMLVDDGRGNKVWVNKTTLSQALYK